MKTILYTLTLALTAMTTAAQEVENNWHFEVNGDGTATVINYEHDTKVWINGMETIGTTTYDCYSGDACHRIKKNPEWTLAVLDFGFHLTKGSGAVY